MYSYLRTDSTNEDFVKMVKLLDEELAEIDGDDHDFYAQYNKIDAIKNALVLYENKTPFGCGAFKPFDSERVEIKRMYVVQSARNRGLATQILLNLESWAKELQYKFAVLETGKRQPDAIRLYEKNGYSIITNFGQYAGVENSVCFEKML
ncbi:MAG: GNAT family N-acetyltransferase [Cytophagales bacterium]|nr:GNAT family N-acetyltransferase [Cytophagales bacterium]